MSLPETFDYGTLETRPKTWKKDYIIKGLKTDEKSYDKLYSMVRERMGEVGLLGARLNDRRNRVLMRDSMKDIRKRFGPGFDSAPSEWQDACIMQLAMKCTYAERRRIPKSQRRSQSSHSHVENPSPAPPELPQAKPKPLYSCLADVPFSLKYEDGTEELLAQVRDIVQDGTDPENIQTMEDLDFAKFLNIVKIVPQVDTEKQHLVWRQGPATVGLEDTAAACWRITLKDMLVQKDFSHFAFDVVTYQ